MIPVVLFNLINAILASSQPLASENNRFIYLSRTSMKQSSPNVSGLLNEHPALSAETRQFLECSTSVKQTSVVLEQQGPILADHVKTAERHNDRLDSVVAKHGIDRGLYNFPTGTTSAKDSKKQIRDYSAFGRSNQ